MTGKNTYTPVSCALHSEYELLVMRRQPVTLQWLDNGQVINAPVLPVDLQTIDGAEYLVIQYKKEIDHVRLDCIQQFDTVTK